MRRLLFVVPVVLVVSVVAGLALAGDDSGHGPLELIEVRARSVPDDGPPGGGGFVGDPAVSTVSFPLKARNTIPVPTRFFEGGNCQEMLQILFWLKMTGEGIASSLGNHGPVRPAARRARRRPTRRR